MKIRVEGSHDIRTIEHVKSITISPESEDDKSLVVLSNSRDKSLTIEEEDNG